MPTYYRTDQSAIHLAVDGITIDNNVWDSMEGGDNTAETVQYAPGAMGQMQDHGGIPKRSEMTLTREWSDLLVSIYKQLDLAVGAARVTASYSVLDANKNVVAGSTITYTGTLKGINRPNYQAGQAESAKLQVVIALDEDIS